MDIYGDYINPVGYDQSLIMEKLGYNIATPKKPKEPLNRVIENELFKIKRRENFQSCRIEDYTENNKLDTNDKKTNNKANNKVNNKLDNEINLECFNFNETNRIIIGLIFILIVIIISQQILFYNDKLEMYSLINKLHTSMNNNNNVSSVSNVSNVSNVV